MSRARRDAKARVAQTGGLAVVTAFAALFAMAPAARAAFEVRDATPAALGAASLDREAPPFFERADAGLTASASHASLYQSGGLTSERASLSFAFPRLRASASWNQLGFPGAREHTLRVAVEERGSGPVALSVVAERLALAIDGEPPRGGCAFGAAADAAVPLASAALECSVAGDRILQTGDLAALGSRPSLPFLLRLRASGVAIAWIDRWEASGATSPRLVIDLALGRSARIRVARGMDPARGGAAVALRRGRLELSVARLDLDAGGAVTSAAVGLRAPGLEPGGGGR